MAAAATQQASEEAASTFKPAPSIAALPKSWHFTSSLPPDPLFPTPADSHRTPRDQILPRQVRGAAFTWVRPAAAQDPELLAVSPAALRDLGLAPDVATSDPEFVQTFAGNVIHGWDNEKCEGEGYPWAQCYGGFQFGQWAGQLGDGRAISLFETTNPVTGTRYEVQLKGAGLTPYSRFADGRAVLRSSIREFVVSEALYALGIPTTRALALVLLPRLRVRRETLEPGAITTRFAESWIRLGNFDLLRARGDRDLLRMMANYVAESVFGGWEKLPGRLDDAIVEEPGKVCQGVEMPMPKRHGVPMDETEGEGASAENRYARLYREIVRRNAATVAQWQVYGFMNGVLNTDNTSIMGLSMDYGPFAFMDTFDPAYTPNHDDHFLRYSYRNQPTIIWWNLVRLGEALAELIGAGPGVDDAKFIEEGVQEDQAPDVIARAEKLIGQAGEEYKAVFLAEYRRLMSKRLGLRTYRGQRDFNGVFSALLDVMEALELDFNMFFRRLGAVRLDELETEDGRRDVAGRFFSADADPDAADGRKRVAEWLDVWRRRVAEDWSVTETSGIDGAESSQNGATVTTSSITNSTTTGVSSLPEAIDAKRRAAMNAVNPNFVPRGWILDEVISRVKKKGERDVLRRIITMALHPFEDSWHGRTFDGVHYEGDPTEEARWTGEPPKTKRAMQCSCSS